MTVIKIDNKDYTLESLPEQARANLASLHFVDGEIQRLQAQLAAMVTARVAYAKALQEGLPSALSEMSQHDTIPLG